MAHSIGYVTLVATGLLISSYISLTWHSQYYWAKHFAGAPDNGTTYDFIVVGSGASGSVVAARLGEAGHSVLLVEAGGPSHWLQGMAAMIPHFLDGLYDWGYEIQSQDRAMLARKDKKVPYPRGKVLGGSTMVNWMLYVRGHSEDYDEWEKLGNPGWGYKDVLPYFHKSENYVGSTGTEQFHGTEGPLQVQDCVYKHPVEEIHLRGWQELGHKIGDVNGDHEGGGFFRDVPLTQRSSWRLGTYGSFVVPLLGKSDITVLPFSTASRITFDGDVANGVELERFGQILHYGVAKEVILSAGSFGSPQILMLSGIGPKHHLDDLGIEVKKNLSVGENLQDHLIADLVFVTKKNGLSASPFALFNPWSILQAFWQGRGPLLTNSANVNGMVSTPLKDGNEKRPDVQIHSSAFDFNADYGLLATTKLNVDEQAFEHYYGKFASDHHGMLAHATLLRPQSRGVLTLKSKSIHDPPILDFRFLDKSRDAKILAEGAKIIHKLSTTKAFKSNGLDFVGPDTRNCGQHEAFSDDYWDCHVRHWMFHLYHASGTCKMGTDSEAVVDHRLKVRGIKGLRVIDASIMPKVVGGNTMAPCIMIGEKGADMMLQEWNNIKNSKQKGLKKDEL